MLGVVAARGLLPDLATPVSDVLPALRGTPAKSHTWWHLLTMTRGAAVKGAWDPDELFALPGRQVPHIARAPQVQAPGTGFLYDHGAAAAVGGRRARRR